MNNYNISSILKNINNTKISYSINKNTNKNLYLNFKQIHYDNIYDAQFVNSRAYNDTLKYLTKFESFKIIINELQINLYIFCQYNYNWKQLVNKIYKYLKLFYKTFKTFIVNSNSLELNIFIYTLPYKNVFNKHILGTDDINSGYTQFKPEKSKKIVIYKTHKLTKVLIHELIHFFNIDITILSQNIYKTIDNFIQSNVKTNYKILTFEGITEFFAIYLNTIYKYNKLSKTEIKLMINKQINIYTKYMNIILKNQNIKKITDLFNNNGIVFKQNTNVFSYYILATLLFKNYKMLFKSHILHKDIIKILFK
jgi:hypothetical protein